MVAGAAVTAEVGAAAKALAASAAVLTALSFAAAGSARLLRWRQEAPTLSVTVSRTGTISVGSLLAASITTTTIRMMIQPTMTTIPPLIRAIPSSSLEAVAAG